MQITPELHLPDDELLFDFVRSSGPGGQNINKVSTAVLLRLDVRNSPSLPEPVKERLTRLAGSRMTSSGILQIEARRFRSQEQNRLDACLRLEKLIRSALEEKKPRLPTRPTRAAVQKRIETKKQRGQVKRVRQGHDHPE